MKKRYVLFVVVCFFLVGAISTRIAYWKKVGDNLVPNNSSYGVSVGTPLTVEGNEQTVYEGMIESDTGVESVGMSRTYKLSDETDGTEDVLVRDYAMVAGTLAEIPGPARGVSKLDLTADTVITEAQILANKWISNQGDAGEADLTLPAVSYVITVNFVVEEAQNIEINPPSGETPVLNGTTLDADDCIDSDSTVGSIISAIRHQNDAGTWLWYFHTAYGVWTNTGPSD